LTTSEVGGGIGEKLIMVGPREYTLHHLVQYTAQVLHLRRWIVPLPDFASRMEGALMDFVPGKPFSTDNYHSLQVDNTSVANDLWRFGMTPQRLENVVPYYLDHSVRQQRLDRLRAR
jgi:hypothetical protein